MGHTLALLAKTNAAPSNVPAVRLAGGEISTETSVIVDTFAAYYKDLYRSKKGEAKAQMKEFFREIGTPVLSEEDRNAMESPITLMELQQAVKGLSNQKSPGPDGLPAEFYKQYGEVLLPELLKTLNWAI